MAELAKQYAPSEIEGTRYNQWIEAGYFKEQDSTDGAYSILMPPPNVTGILTMGHVLNHTIQDIYIRRSRMQGKKTCWFPGLDHAGIATQTKVEQQLRKEKISRYDLGREKFLDKVWEWKNQYGGIILDQLRALGNSCDWDRTLFTLDDSASDAVRDVFIALFDEGLIYRGKRIINWSPVAMSALSDEEVQFKEVKEKFYTLRYYLEDSSEYICVGTVRPETLFGDVAVAVNPSDERYQHLIGKNVRVPLAGQLVPIIADDYADPTFGTGCVKITPAHDPNDFEVGQRHNLPQPNTMNPDGTLNELTGEYNGMERFAARKKIALALEEQELVEKIEDYTHNVGFSERGGEPVEPYLSDQWFVKMAPLAQPALEVVQKGEIRFFPEHWVKTYEHWMTNIRDWCISRQLWWGHRIPVYYTADGRFTAAASATEAAQKLGVANPAELRQDEDVLDTWFSSWLWPMTTMGWQKDTPPTKDMQTYLPTDLLVTGPDIIFFWVARMIMASLKFTGKIPFRDVYFTSILRDSKGRKLSKSLGNSPDPLKLFESYGADAVRFTVISLAPIGQDVKIAVNEKTQDVDQMEFGRNFANKLWNAARFLLMKREEFSSLGTAPLAKEDFDVSTAWITHRFNETIRATEKALDDYRLHEYSKTMYDFVWGDFCDWYVEIVKILTRTDAPERAAARVEHAIAMFDGITRLLHPVMPFITEELWQGLYQRDGGETLCLASMPFAEAYPQNELAVEQFEEVRRFIEEVRSLRGLLNLPPQQRMPVAIHTADSKLTALLLQEQDILHAFTRAESLTIGENVSKPKGSIASVIMGSQIYVTVEGLIDFAAEKTRLSAEVERLTKMAGGVEAKLSNEKFTANAPADIVQYERDKLANIRQTIEKLQSNIADLSV